MAEEQKTGFSVVQEFKVENYPEKGTTTYFARWTDGKVTAQLESEKSGTTMAKPIEEVFTSPPQIYWEKTRIFANGKQLFGEDSGSSDQWKIVDAMAQGRQSV